MTGQVVENPGTGPKTTVTSKGERHDLYIIKDMPSKNRNHLCQGKIALNLREDNQELKEVHVKSQRTTNFK